VKKIICVLVITILSLIIYLYSNNFGNSSRIPILEISPTIIYPGDPIFIEIIASSTPSKILFDNMEIKVSKYNNSYIGLVGIDLHEEKKKHEIKLELVNGIKINKSVTITMRTKEEKPLGIPDNLGGNTPEAGVNLLNNISKENSSINNIKLDPISFWQNSKFGPPLKTLFITDKYGYSRNTAGYSIAHKGTDFRAQEGTEVMAINKGTVRISRLYTLSGNTVVIDHGAGLVSIYMHLSKLNVKEGEEVEVGQIIGLSGKTGYALGAHLHLGIKINGVSIDPERFLRYFNVL
jgi:murein DD-endopeptidase MepM/ murein hydrolase activator NlpD